MPVATTSAQFFLGGIDKAKKLLLDAFLHDVKVATMPASVGTVGTTSSTILAANQHRVYTIITNTSDTDIDIAFGETAVSGRGVRIVCNGGTYTIDWTNLWQGAVNAICAAANKNVAIVDGRTD